MATETVRSGFEPNLYELSRSVFRLFSRLREHRTRAYGVPAGHWAILRPLWREDGINQHELSRRAAMHDPSIAVAIRSMERASLVGRRINLSDRREILVFLTPLAKQLESKLFPIVNELQNCAFRGFSDGEVEVLQSLMLRVIENLLREDGKLQ